MGIAAQDPEWLQALFTGTQRAVLGLLFGHTERSFFANEIVRVTRKGVGAVHRELERLVSSGLLVSHRVGNQRHYQANTGSPVFSPLKTMFEMIPDTTAPAIAESGATYTIGGQLSVTRRALAAFCRRHHVRTLSLFGSATRPDFGPDSDIDLLVEFEPGRAPGLGGMVRLQQDAAALFPGRRVDVATPSVLENPWRRRSIERDVRLLYAA